MTRTPSPALGRWIAVVALLLISGGALVGNAPAPSLRIVRHASAGDVAPRVEAAHARLRILLPEDRQYVALRLWEHGQPAPTLVARALRPDRPLPAAITITAQPPELRSPDYQVEGADPTSDLGWFAVEVRDARGNTAATFFEAGRQPPKGYLACSPPKVQRQPGARALAPEAVRAAFEPRFRAVPWAAAAPPPPPGPPAKRK
jgi:hypothetical protein